MRYSSNHRPGRKVVITGIGVVAPNGIGREAFWQALREGKNCVDRISLFDPSGHPSQVAAEARSFRPEMFIPRKEIKRMSRSAQMAVAAAQLAISDARLKLTKGVTKRASVVLGTGVAGTEYAEDDFYAIKEGGVRKMRPFAGIAGFSGALSSEVSRASHLTGFSLTLSTGCTGGTDALGYALNAIRSGFVDLVIAGGADACVTPGILGAFCQMGAVSTHFNNEPRRASRPFNRDRDGFVIAEGAWLFILEAVEHAIRRKAKIYAELAGYGATCDAYHMSNPHPSGRYTAEAIRLALIDAHLSPKDIQYFNAYGNSTPINDSYETKVIKIVFGKHAYRLAVSSTKSMLGHPIGAAGACGLAASVMAISDGWIPPTINQENPDPACDLDYVPNLARPGNIYAAVCNTLAFGSKNSALVVKRFELRKKSRLRLVDTTERTSKPIFSRQHQTPARSCATVETLIVNAKLEDVFCVAERYPTFVRSFRKSTVLSRDAKSMTFEIGSSLFGIPITWLGRGHKRPYSHIKFVQLQGILKGLRATWYFEESSPGVTKITIMTNFKVRVPIVGKLLQWILANKVARTTRAILSDLKLVAEIAMAGRSTATVAS